MDSALMTARLKAFGFEAGAIILTAVAGVLMSPEFSALITSNFGTGTIASLAVLVVSGIAKHFYNLQQVKKLGAKRDAVVLI